MPTNRENIENTENIFLLVNYFIALKKHKFVHVLSLIRYVYLYIIYYAFVYDILRCIYCAQTQPKLINY